MCHQDWAQLANSMSRLRFVGTEGERVQWPVLGSHRAPDGSYLLAGADAAQSEAPLPLSPSPVQEGAPKGSQSDVL